MSVLSALAACAILLLPALAQDEGEDDGDGDGESTDAVAGEAPGPDAPGILDKYAFRPYFRPEGGASAWSSTSGSTLIGISLGAQGGAYFWQKTGDRPRVEGLGRVRAAKLFGTGVNGTALSGGVFAGPGWKRLQATIGPDVFWNQYTWGSVELSPTLGVATPIQLSAQVTGLSLVGGVEPRFFISSDRPSVNWDTQDFNGIGDEFSWFVGGVLGGRGASLNVSYSQTFTAYGIQRGFGVAMRVGR